jgi:hypothetical protein
MRDFGIKRSPANGADRTPRLRDGDIRPSRQTAERNEVFQVLREIGIHLAAFLGIGLAANLLLVLLGLSRIAT